MQVKQGQILLLLLHLFKTSRRPLLKDDNDEIEKKSRRTKEIKEKNIFLALFLNHAKHTKFYGTILYYPRKPINQSIDTTPCELLSYLSFQYDKADRECLFSAMSDFYTFEESTAAKQILIDECDKLGLSEAISDFKKRRQNAKGDGNVKVVRDIIDIWGVIDCQKAGKTTSSFPVRSLTKTSDRYRKPCHSN